MKGFLIFLDKANTATFNRAPEESVKHKDGDTTRESSTQE